MHIIHGTWIPEDTHEFIQRGAFYLWVETDTPTGAAKGHTDSVHPRHLAQSALATFLMEKLGLREFAPGTLARTLSTRYFLLPTAAGKPAPCFELLRYVDEEEPVEFDLQSWQVCCYQVPDIITTLNDIHFIALTAANDFQLGADLVFLASVLPGHQKHHRQRSVHPCPEVPRDCFHACQREAGEERSRLRASPRLGTAVRNL